MRKSPDNPVLNLLCKTEKKLHYPKESGKHNKAINIPATKLKKHKPQFDPSISEDLIC
jgi:hypothetical protein